MDEQLIDRLTRELKAARVAMVEAQLKRAEVYKEQAALGKLLMAFLLWDKSPVTLRLLCRKIQASLAPEDQAEAAVDATIQDALKIDRQIRAMTGKG